MKERRVEDGYILVYAPDHPLARHSGYVPEHRMVAWDAGLFDDPELEVHHRNGEKWDNRVGNLKPETKAEHTADHMAEALRGFTAVSAAATDCPEGHPYDEANTYIDHAGRRRCKRCIRDQQRRYRARKRSSTT